MKYKVIKDTREKNGWDFENMESCWGTDLGCLQTGDYTIAGFEDVLCIERKASTAEIANNLGTKKEQFEAEMQRMTAYTYPFILLEFSMSDLLKYPDGSSIPNSKKKFIKLNGRYLLKTLIEYQIFYNVKILFCDNRDQAIKVCDSIFKRIQSLKK